MEIKLDNQLLVLSNVYAPNDASQQIKFFQDLNKTLADHSDKNVIIEGDFSCALTPKDRKSVKQVSNKQALTNEIGNICSNVALRDISIESNPQTLSFVFHMARQSIQVPKPTRFFLNHDGFSQCNKRV